jgi:hypothetical protein
VVSEAGVTPLRSDAESWPASYRNGVAAGLLLDGRGRLSLRSRFVEDLAAIVTVMDIDEWRELSEQARTALWAEDLAGDRDRQSELADLLASLASTLDQQRRAGWLGLADRLRTGGHPELAS